MILAHTAHPITSAPSSRLRAGTSPPLFPSARDRLPTAVLHGCLEDGLMVCLSLLARDPERFAPAAVAWHSRWCARLCGIDLEESHAALCALEGLAGPDPAAAARALCATCRRHELDEVAAVLEGWLDRDPRSGVAGSTQPPPRPLTAA